MVNVLSKQCEHPGCTKRPHFNRPGEKTGRFCGTHKDHMSMVKLYSAQIPRSEFPLYAVA